MPKLFEVKEARTVEEVRDAAEQGFEYICTFKDPIHGDVQLYRKPIKQE